MNGWTLSRLRTHDLTSFCGKERETTCRIRHVLQQNVWNAFIKPKIPSKPPLPFLPPSSPPAWGLRLSPLPLGLEV